MAEACGAALADFIVHCAVRAEAALFALLSPGERPALRLRDARDAFSRAFMAFFRESYTLLRSGGDPALAKEIAALGKLYQHPPRRMFTIAADACLLAHRGIDRSRLALGSEEEYTKSLRVSLAPVALREATAAIERHSHREIGDRMAPARARIAPATHVRRSPAPALRSLKGL